MGFWSSIWDGICSFARASWNLMCSIVDAIFDFIDDTLDALFTMLAGMFTGIIDLLKQGLAKLYVLVIPPKEEILTNPDADDFYNMIEKKIKDKGKNIKKVRFAVQTDANGKVKNVKTYYNSKGSSIEGFDSTVKEEGITEIVL